MLKHLWASRKHIVTSLESPESPARCSPVGCSWLLQLASRLGSGFLILAVGAMWKATIVGKVAAVAMIMMIMGVGRHGSCLTWCTADLVVAPNGCWLTER
jgi:hypothetical protein